MAALDPAVADLLHWLVRDLDDSAEIDDVAQILMLAQLEVQAAAPTLRGPALVRAVYRRARRAIWQVRNARGHLHRVPWRHERLRYLAGPEADPAVMEDLGWDDVVRLLGWQEGLVVWLSIVESWSLSEIAAWQVVTKQQAWRRLQHGLAVLRDHLAPPRAG